MRQGNFSPYPVKKAHIIFLYKFNVKVLYSTSAMMLGWHKELDPRVLMDCALSRTLYDGLVVSFSWHNGAGPLQASRTS